MIQWLLFDRINAESGASSVGVEHHFSGLERLLDDEVKAKAIRTAINNRNISAMPLDKRQKLAMRYAEQLTLNPSDITQQVISELRNAGYSDGEILEINQVCAYFSYANRTVLGLGCSIDDLAGDGTPFRRHPGIEVLCI